MTTPESLLPPKSWLTTPLPRVLAHRGLHTHAVENTLPAFHAAVAAGVRYLESDVHGTSDGVAVLFHDDTLERDFGTRATIESLTERELRDRTAGIAHIPTLVEALAALPEVRWNLDIKTKEAIHPAAAAINAARAADRVLIAGFSGMRASRTAAAIVPRPVMSPGMARVAGLVLAARCGMRRLAQRLAHGFAAIQVPERMYGVTIVTPLLITRYHQAGLEVHVWTVNEPEDMRRLLRWGVDGIVTDRCDLAIPIAQEFRA